ncbi:FIG00003370: Multicopper polyphenol oxidase [hydrothermal vent metagenome]|uniref:FIG00003370: Multicopper polyphenol oxidase n=1 Tax=hydrothermal vent metagenome TaxID=652676 RepID=A0A3B0WZQ8_9ZZZZ
MFITPNWPAPQQIKALCTTREGGVSFSPFDSFNLALHVGDNPKHVAQNRQRLIKHAQLPSSPVWLNQQHTDVAIELSQNNPQKMLTPEHPLLSRLNSPCTPPIADASWTTQAGCVSIVMTADCLPLLITNKQGTLVSAIHAGWKGLHLGIVTKTIKLFLTKEKGRTKAEDLLVWIGPAISKKHFEVGQNVFDDFIQKDSENKPFFTKINFLDKAENKAKKQEPKYLADLVGIVQQELNKIDITQVFGGELCTYAQSEKFYSYRRSGKTGRIASCIWIEEHSF